MHNERKAVNTVTTVYTLHDALVQVGCIEQTRGINRYAILPYPLMMPYIRRVRIHNMHFVEELMTREHIQMQGNNTVAAVKRIDQRIRIIARYMEETYFVRFR